MVRHHLIDVLVSAVTVLAIASTASRADSNEHAVGFAIERQALLKAADLAAGDQLGVSVAISGDVAIVGAPFDDVGTNNEQGSAYISFARDRRGHSR
jgi:hypothetical protein